jgi:hypothetical protein
MHFIYADCLHAVLPPSLSCVQLEAASLRSNELVDLQARMAAAMQRIAELEAATQRSHPAGARPNGNDDTRAVIRDNKFRRTPRMSPHGSSRSPGADPYLYSSGDAATAAASNDNVKLRTRQVCCITWACTHLHCAPEVAGLLEALHMQQGVAVVS